MPQPAPISAGREKLVFDWLGDRFGHRMWLEEPGRRPGPLLDSVEGAPDELWPASPPLQEFHVETRGPGQLVALLVGRAGRSHWSLSVLCDAEREALWFEAACRIGQAPSRSGQLAGWLGSRYRAGKDLHLVADNGRPIEPPGACPAPGATPLVDAGVATSAGRGLWLAGDGSDWTVGPESSRAWLLASAMQEAGSKSPIDLSLAAEAALPDARTICWAYRFAIAEHATA